MAEKNFTQEQEKEEVSSLIVLAKTVHDEHIEKAKQKADTIVRQAEAHAEQLRVEADTYLGDAQTRAHNIVEEANTQGKNIVNEAKIQGETILEDARTEEKHIQNRINKLLAVEVEYRNRLEKTATDALSSLEVPGVSL